MSFSIVRRLFGRGMASHRSARSSVRLHLEGLEARYAPATIRVGPSASVQAAINRAHSGDTIEVIGKHQEQIVIVNEAGHSRNFLKIVGVNDRSIIVAPPSMTNTNAVVEVRGARSVTISCLTISGPNTGTADTFYGILVHAGGSAKIANNRITSIADRPLSGAQRGVAIQVGSTVPGVSPGSATITDNFIDRYQKNGIRVSGAGSNAYIDDNAILGAGPTTLIAQNGIQISDGATAKITDNCISGNVYKPEPFAATGILLLNPGAVTVEENSLTKNDVGVFVFQSKAAVVIDDNYVVGNQLIGILLDTTSGARVTNNYTGRNGSGHAEVDGGISIFASTGNRIEGNTSDFNKGAGIYVHSDSVGNTFNNNRVRGNTIFDAEDRSTGKGTAGTGNTWRNNVGKRSNVPGILKSFDSDRDRCD
jgi:parallel beta-helix repeat protein